MIGDVKLILSKKEFMDLLFREKEMNLPMFAEHSKIKIQTLRNAIYYRKPSTMKIARAISEALNKKTFELFKPYVKEE